MPWTWKLIQANCTGCGICADVCREEALFMPRNAAYPAPVPAKCTGCGTCVEECPFDAVELEEAEEVRRQSPRAGGERAGDSP